MHRRFTAPIALLRYVAHKGSICVDGVSLTVNEIPRPGVLQVSIIEYTLRHTTLGALAVGDRVHLEGDVVGKFVRSLVRPYVSGGEGR